MGLAAASVLRLHSHSTSHQYTRVRETFSQRPYRNRNWRECIATSISTTTTFLPKPAVRGYVYYAQLYFLSYKHIANPLTPLTPPFHPIIRKNLLIPVKLLKNQMQQQIHRQLRSTPTRPRLLKHHNRMPIIILRLQQIIQQQIRARAG
jgi:hypothetical protein